MYQLTGPVNYCRPSLVDGYNQGSPVTARAYPLPSANTSAVFHAGDLLQLITVGTLTYAIPLGSGLAFQPTVAPTIATSSSGSAGLAILYGFYTYTDGSTSNVSLPSPWFAFAVPAGQVATVTVPTAGAPSWATDFALYLGYNPYQAWQQVLNTALGSAATVPNPLTNYQGAGLSANNPSANILGLAQDDWDVLYQSGPAFSMTGNKSLFGADVTSLDPEQYQIKFTKLGGSPSQRFVISLLQPFNSGVLNQTAGIVYSTTQNVFYLDTTQSNKVVTIVDVDDNLDNWPASQPFDTGLAGAQVIAAFNSGVLP